MPFVWKNIGGKQVYTWEDPPPTKEEVDKARRLAAAQAEADTARRLGFPDQQILEAAKRGYDNSVTGKYSEQGGAQKQNVDSKTQEAEKNAIVKAITTGSASAQSWRTREEFGTPFVGSQLNRYNSHSSDFDNLQRAVGLLTGGSAETPPEEDTITNKGNIYEYGASLKDTYKDLSDQDLINYLLYNPDLREYAEAQGLFGKQAADWARAHWHDHGIKNAGRINKPGSAAEMGDPSRRNQEFAMGTIPKVYADKGLKSLDEIFKWHLGKMTPSEMWEVRTGLDPKWNLQNFQPEGWRYQEDIPYGEGLLGNTLALSGSLGSDPVGQLIDTEERRFLQDRFEDNYQRNDFPAEWVQGGDWTGPPSLEGYWDTLKGAVRDDQGILRAAWDRPYEGWGNFEAPEDFTVTRPQGKGLGMLSGDTVLNPPLNPNLNPNLSGSRGYGEYLATNYERPEPRDISNIMPDQGLLHTDAQRALVAQDGLLYQPEAMGGLLPYAPRGSLGVA